MYEDIKRQFSSVIQYSQDIPNPKLDDLFDKWVRAKRKFIDQFGGLIYEWPDPIEFTLDSREQRKLAMDFADCVGHTFNNPALAHFLDDNVETFFDNKVSNSDMKEIPKGMKLVKAFKYFEEDKTTLNKIQSLASQLIQENKVKGTLCFSVHPLDFLSSSENNYNWRSCHSLDGEYRAGNLSYMTDETTFMVYLKGADNEYIPNFGDVSWNSKKWRMLIHCAPDDSIMFAGRQYPFSSKTGIDIVLDIYNEFLASSNKYGKWRNDYIDTYKPNNSDEIYLLDEKYFANKHKLFGLRDIVHKGDNSLNYNDVLYSTCYRFPYYTTSLYSFNISPITIGNGVKCLQCGKELISNSETMRCDDCELRFGEEENDVYGICDRCGRRIYLDDCTITENGDTICEFCFERECFVCDRCGEVVYKEDGVFIPDDDANLWYCKYCYEELKKEK